MQRGVRPEAGKKEIAHGIVMPGQKDVARTSKFERCISQLSRDTLWRIRRFDTRLPQIGNQAS